MGPFARSIRNVGLSSAETDDVVTGENGRTEYNGVSEEVAASGT